MRQTLCTTLGGDTNKYHSHMGGSYTFILQITNYSKQWCGSGSRSGSGRIRIHLGPWIRIRIQRYKMTDKIKGKVEFNQQKLLLFFCRKLYVSILNLKKSRFRVTWKWNFFWLLKLKDVLKILRFYGPGSGLDPDPDWTNFVDPDPDTNHSGSTSLIQS